METKIGKRAFYLVLAILLSLGLSGCGSKKSMRESPSYKDTKHMVLDILKTPEGKKALKQSIKGEESESGDSEGSEGSNEEGSSSQSDSMKIQSEEEISKIVKKESKKQLKTLSSDPEFQKAVIAVTKTPEFQNTLRMEMIQIMTQMQEGLMKTQGQKGKKSEGQSEEGGGEDEKGSEGGESDKQGG